MKEGGGSREYRILRVELDHPDTTIPRVVAHGGPTSPRPQNPGLSRLDGAVLLVGGVQEPAHDELLGVVDAAPGDNGPVMAAIELGGEPGEEASTRKAHVRPCFFRVGRGHEVGMAILHLDFAVDQPCRDEIGALQQTKFREHS